MRLEQLQYLLEIGQTGSMNLAGENLHVSQQAISTAIRLLEEELGAALLVRTSKGVQFTAAGKKALAAAEDVLGRIAKLRLELREETENEPQELMVLMHSGMLRGEMARLIPQLYEVFDEYQLKILSCQNHDMVETIASGKAYLGLTYALKEDVDKIQKQGLSFQRLATYHFGVFVSKHSTFAQCRKVPLAEVVQQYPIMMFEDIYSENNLVQSLMRLKNLQDQVRYLTVSETIFNKMIEADKAAGVVFQNKQDKMVEIHRKCGIFIPLTDAIPVYSGYIIAKENEDAWLTQRFKALLQQK